MISVIIPAYNCEGTLEKAVDSILVQTFRDFELIIVNDGSSDSTESVARRLASRDKRVKVITTENGGEGKARNRGIDEASGEYLCFVDSDDWVEPEFLEALFRQAEEGSLPCVGMSFNGDGIPLMHDIPDNTYLVSERVADDLLMGPLTKGILYSVCNKLFDAAVLREHDIRFFGGFKVGEDLLFTLRYICCCRKVTVDNRSLYCYFISASSVIHSADNDLISWDDKLLDQLSKFSENGITLSKEVLQLSSFDKLVGRLCNGYPATLTSQEFKDYCRNTVFTSLLYQYGIRDKSKVGFQRAAFRFALQKKSIALLRLLIKGKGIF